ncbi:MAG: GNAT family N-acetyltransferase [Beijerinckiaceae bacterium]|nr:GNAT family N-acetyltransferase [Beijerinckiaceae bacterium]
MTTKAISPLLIRPARPGDMEAITTIYAREVLEGVATFEYKAPDASEMDNRYRERTGAGYPWLVAECQGVIAGFAYASAFHARPGYHYTVEDTIYLAPGHQRRGIGTALLKHLIRDCEAAGYRQMMSLIGDSANAGSIQLHRNCGFEDAGVWKSTGWKFGRWIDVVVMQRPLGKGSTGSASTTIHATR